MTTVQILLITLIAYWKMTDTVTLQLFAFNTIICGWLVGLVMGDPATGLTIGATLQLMSMGVVAVGGSSMPDYNYRYCYCMFYWTWNGIWFSYWASSCNVRC